MEGIKKMDIIKILEDHGILHYVTGSGSIMALESYMDIKHDKYINVTNWTCKQLAEWLGY